MLRGRRRSGKRMNVPDANRHKTETGWDAPGRLKPNQEEEEGSPGRMGRELVWHAGPKRSSSPETPASA